MRFLFHCISAFLALQISSAAWADDTARICPSDTKTMRSHAGTYVDSGLIERIKRTRIWDTGTYRVTEVIIDDKGVVGLGYAWHEGGSLEPKQCLSFHGDALTISGPAAPATQFVRVPQALSETDVEPFFFGLLFKGCYRDQNQKRWCFTTHGIAIDGTQKTAQLQLDMSELPEGGSVLKVQNEKLFWVFKPKGDGWLVERADWASAEGYKPPNWSRPWTRLTPEQ